MVFLGENQKTFFTVVKIIRFELIFLGKAGHVIIHATKINTKSL